MSAQQLQFNLKFGDRAPRFFDLEIILKPLKFIQYLKANTDHGVEIHIRSSCTSDATVFLLDPFTFDIQLNANKNGVVLSQYGIDVYELLAVDGADHNRYYSICAEKLSNYYVYNFYFNFSCIF